MKLCTTTAQPDRSVYGPGRWAVGGGRRILTLAAAPVGRISVEAGNAVLAVSARRQVLALLTHALVDALTVTITLTRCQGGNKAQSA